MIDLTTMLAALSPVERVRALTPGGSGESSSSQMEWDWTVWLPAVLVVAAVVLIGLVSAWLVRRRAARSLVRSADRLGLSAEERTVLARIAAGGGLKWGETVFTAERAFNQGAARLAAAPAVAAMSEQAKQHLGAVVRSLREKLGFPEKTETWSDRRQKSVPVPAGGDVAIILASSAESVQATVMQAGEEEIVVQPVEPMQAKVGDTWRMRHITQGIQLEFDAAIQEVAGEQVRLRLVSQQRCVNFRRFVRVPTCKPAHIALLPFVAQSSQGLPEFVAGTVTQIAGPGFQVRSSLQVEVGGRVLVVVQLSSGDNVQGVGIVRRCSACDDGLWDTAAEMTGLSESEVARLVRETNEAAKQAETAAESVSAPALN